jgi:hypothetical protein
MDQIQKKNFLLLTLALSILLVSAKWILSYYYFEEDIILRVINDSSDTAYYPIIKTFSDFNMSPSFSNKLDGLDIISFPILSLFLNSFFFKILGGYSFIFLEFLCTAFFILIFYNIFLKLKFSNFYAIICSTFLFILPTLLIDLSFVDSNALDLLTVNFQKFYSMRFPRPIISNLFFFAFIYYAIDFFLQKENYTKNFYTLSILMGLSLNCFFYLFFIEFFLIVIIFFLKFKINFFKILIENFKCFFYSSLIILLFILIFQIQILNSEADYIERLGVSNLNSNQKIIIFDYLYNFFFSKNFIFLFFLNLFIFFLVINKPIKIFYFLFLSSILSTIFFFSTSERLVDYYHFFVLIVITGFLFPTVYFLQLAEVKFFKFFSSNSLKMLMKFSLFVIIFYFNISISSKFINNAERLNIERNNLSQVTNFINKNNLFEDNNLEILNLNINLSTWLLLNDYKNFSIIPVSFWTPKKNQFLENELISTLKFFELNKNDFYNLIKNKKSSWRFKNEFIYVFFGRKYLANSVVNFNNNINDFEDVEKKFINNNSIISSHQVIIPKVEIKRLLNKFDLINNQINPDIVVLDKFGFLKLDVLNNNIFCLAFKNESFSIYINKKLDINCL